MPNNWKTYKLGNISTINGGKRMPKGHNLVEYQTDHPYIRVRDMNKRTINKSDLLFVPDSVFEKISKYTVAKNDIIISVVGTIGNIAMIDDNISGANLTENCNKISKLKNLDFTYLYYFLISNIGQSEIAKGVVGSTQPKLPLYSVRDIEINIPPLQEQEQIASILSVLDDKIENNLAMNKALEDMAMALYKHWFVDFGPFQEGEFVDSELGMIPKGWEVKTLNNILEIKYGKDHKKLEEGIIPVYGTGGIMRYVNQSLYEKESILIPRKGSLNNLFYTKKPFWTVDTLFYSKIKLCGFGKYSFHFLKSLDLANMDVGSAVPSLTTQLLNKINVIVPANQVVLKYDETVTIWFDTIDSNIVQNQTLTQLRDTLLPKLISGEVRLKEFKATIANAL